MATEASSPPATFMDVLDGWASSRPDAIAYVFLGDGDLAEKTLTFGELRRRALSVAERLSWLDARGDRAVLLYPQGLEFIVAFFGCLYAGVVAVPVSVPNRKRGLEILRRIAADAGARWLLSTGELVGQVSADLSGDASLGALSFVDTEESTERLGAGVNLPGCGPDTLALIQYTSGSTGSPRGVAVTHANLVDNQRQIEQSCGHDQTTRIVSWLPMFHDMGLGTVLQTVWIGTPCVVMSPRAFLQEPRRWLKAITDYRATSSCAPDFAYDLCVRRIGAAERQGLDLSSWRIAANGSEPVRASTIDRFAEAFKSSGFRRESFHPLYGLAEATLIVTSEEPHEGPVVRRFAADALSRGFGVEATDSDVALSLVSCGHTWQGTRLVVVDPETHAECEPGRVGEIWVSGSSVAAGYWAKSAETEHTFGARTREGEGPFLRTGDLGFFANGHLFVTGRHKDLIIVRGRNHYPQDIEDSVSTSHPALVPHACAAFSIEIDQGEELVIVQEVARSALRTLDSASVVRAIRGAVSEHHALHTHAVVLLKPSTLPRTTSGKVRRKTCRDAFLDNSLPAVATWVSPLTTAPEPGIDEVQREPSAQADRLIDWLRRHAADLIHTHAADERLKSPTPLLLDLAKQGLLGMQVGPAYGGLGLGNSDTLRVLEQLAAIDFALAVFVGLNNSLGLQPVAKYARAQVKSLLLPGLVQGQEFAAFAFEEPTGRNTPGGLTVQAQADGDDRWRLFGTKYLDGVGEGASVISVFAHHDEPPGISAFVVSDGAPGLRQVRDGLSRGLLGFARDTVALDGVSVGRENLLGNLGAGMDIAREAMMHARLAIGAACIGGMKRCAQLVGPYSVTINGNLTPNPVLLSRLGSVTASITALECLVSRVARAVDSGYAVPSEAFAACKVLGPELLVRCVDDLMRSSVSGTSAETNRLSRLHRDAGLLRTFDGPPEALAELTGAAVMEDDSSLRRLLEEILHAPEAGRRIEVALDAVRLRMQNLRGALARRAERWGHTRAGELTTWIVLLSAVEGARRATATVELERAHAWAHAQFQYALSAVQFGTPSESAALDSSDVAATFAAYARTIGELDADGPADSTLGGADPSRELARPKGVDPRVRELRTWTIAWLARHLQLPASKIEPGRSFADHGLDSVAAVELAKALSDKLGKTLDETLLWNFSTIDALVEYLAGPGRSDAPAAPAGPVSQRPAELARPAVASELEDEIARLERELRSRS